jgi:hypothetical protein
MKKLLIFDFKANRNILVMNTLDNTSQNIVLSTSGFGPNSLSAFFNKKTYW